ncbi:hypothetical protein ENH_00076370 [Eimeria necatrix]|uniref:Uncharacterized protein n=1 Tax=Eimeria necatrix TaxID=51315 RepID=U6N159_9EIME|nr:hypothetical protein ENH_00076370 [Eimeria necatrix]CDJ69962.1 hypothetical protein ENH_00076370 [Eimeria necatrix]
MHACMHAEKWKERLFFVYCKRCMRLIYYFCLFDFKKRKFPVLKLYVRHHRLRFQVRQQPLLSSFSAVAAAFVAAEGNAHVAAQVGVHPHSSRVQPAKTPN